MMNLTPTMLTTALDVAQEIFNQQTGDELQKLKDHFGKAYNEGKIMAEIAVKLILRIGGVPMQASRDFSPLTPLVFDAEKTYRERYETNWLD
jgi:hypothetical protein